MSAYGPANNIVFCPNRIRTLVSMATYSCLWLIMGKLKIGIHWYLTADVLQKCSLSGPLKNTFFVETSSFSWLPSQPKGKNCQNMLKNQLLSSYLGNKAETFRTVSHNSLCKKKNIAFSAVAQAILLLWQLKVSIDLHENIENWDLLLSHSRYFDKRSAEMFVE